MSKYIDIIRLVDSYRPNSLNDQVKLWWLVSLDGKIAADLMRMDVEEVRSLMDCEYPDGLEHDSLVSFPHEELYLHYLEAKISYSEGEYNDYQNAMESYNAEYLNFAEWYLDNHDLGPGACDGRRHIHYFTAYGLAVKHGFAGSEVDWLHSLTAYRLAQQAGYSGTFDEWLQMITNPIPAFSIGKVITLAGGSSATVSVGGTRQAPVLHFGIPRGIGMDDVLPLIGGKMQGSIDMSGFALTGLPTPVLDTGAAPKKYVDDSVKVATAAAAGAQHTADSAVAAAADAVKAAKNARDAANSKAIKESYSVTLTATGWVGSSAPYAQTVAVPGITEEDSPCYGVVYSNDYDTKLSEKEAFAMVDDLDTATNSVTFTCLENKPTIDLNIQMEVVRNGQRI